MFFNTIPFLWFLAAFLVLYGLCPARFKRWLLLLSSAFFIGYGSLSALLWALLFTAVNYLLGICIQRTRHPKAVMGMAVAVNAVALVSFKLLNAHALGLSFYLFSFMAYLAEVWRGTVEAETDPVRFAGFGLFFPKFLQGPITRYSELGGQLDKPRVSASNIQKGLEEFTLGFILNILVVQKLGEFFGSGYHALITAGYDAISTKLAWLGAVVASLHIYMDWISYMYMALGIARLLGFELPQNFNFPYIARTVGDYYRRWHMTLTRWFKDFVYIPLGGSRKGLLRTVVNVLFVWLLTSLWHGNGLAPKYLLWGVLSGAFVALTPLWRRAVLRRAGKRPGAGARLLGWLPLLLLIPLSWIILRKPDSGFNFILWGMSIGLMIVLERLWGTFVAERFCIGKRLGDGLAGKLWKLVVSVLAHIWVVIPMVLSWVVFTIKDIDQLALYFSRLFPAAGASAGADPADFAKNWKLVGPYVVVGVIFCLPVLDWLKALLSRFNLGKRILRFLDSRLAAWIVSALLAGLFWYAVYVLTQTGSDPMGYAAF